MAAEAHDILLEARKEVFDTLRPLFFPSGSSAVLMKVAAATNTFETIEKLDKSWFFKYSAFRENFLLEIAEGDVLADSIGDATHLQIRDGVTDTIYVIEQGDTIPPLGTDVTWKLRAGQFANRGQFKVLY